MKENHPTIPLTRENIENQLWQYSKFDCKKAVIDVTLTVALCVPMTFLMYFIVKDNNHRFFFDLVCMLLPILPIPIVLFQSYRALIERSCLRRGAYDIVDSSLYYKDEAYNRHGTHYYFYFERFPKCEVDHTAYALAAAGDPFLLVLYRTKRQRVKLFFPAKRYEYRKP